MYLVSLTLILHWARVPNVVLPDRALCLPTFCHSLLTVNKIPVSSSSLLEPLSPLMSFDLLREGLPWAGKASRAGKAGA